MSLKRARENMTSSHTCVKTVRVTSNRSPTSSSSSSSSSASPEEKSSAGSGRLAVCKRVWRCVNVPVCVCVCACVCVCVCVCAWAERGTGVNFEWRSGGGVCPRRGFLEQVSALHAAQIQTFTHSEQDTQLGVCLPKLILKGICSVSPSTLWIH